MSTNDELKHLRAKLGVGKGEPGYEDQPVKGSEPKEETPRSVNAQPGATPPPTPAPAVTGVEDAPRPVAPPAPPPPIPGAAAAGAEEAGSGPGPQDEEETDYSEEIDYLQDPTLELSASEVEVIEEQVAGASERPPIPHVVLTPEIAAAPVEPLEVSPSTWKDERAFFTREAEARLTKHPERSALMWMETARIIEQEGGEVDQLLEHLQRGRGAAPQSTQTISFLRRMMQGRGLWEGALELTEQLIALGGESGDRIGALIEAAGLIAYSRRQAGDALESLRQALELKPGHPVALALKAALHLEQKQDQQAAAALELLAESIDSPADRATCLYSAASILEKKLNQLARAEQDYARAVEFDAEHLPALLALAELHEQMGKWSQLCEDLEQIAGLEIDHPTKLRCLLRAGALHLDRTGDLDAAARVLSAASEMAPENPAPLSRLAYVYEATGRDNALIATLKRRLALTSDNSVKAALWTRIGWLFQTRTHALEEALAAYRQACEAQPGYLPALQALGTIYRQLGDYEQLISILAPEIEGTDDLVRRAMRGVEVGGILYGRLQRTDEAVVAYRRALELSPGLPLAFWPLRELLREQQEHSALIKLLTEQIPAIGDQNTRYHLLLELARLLVGSGEAAPDLAIAALEEARALKGSTDGSRGAGIELTELYRQSGQATELVDLLLAEAANTPDPSESHGRLVQAANVLEVKLDEPVRALEIYASILKRDPANVAALRAAGRIYYRLGRWKELVELYRQEIAHQPERPDVVDLWCRVGRLNDEMLGQPVDAIEAYMEALKRDPRNTVALDALERLLRVEERFEELVEVLEQYAGARKEPLAAADALCRGAELADARLKKPAQALQLYQRIQERGTNSTDSLGAMFTIQQRQRQHKQAAETLERMIEQTTDPIQLGHLQLTLARLKEYTLGQQPDLALYDAAAREPRFGAKLRRERLRVLRLLGEEQLLESLVEISLQTEEDALAAALLLECTLRAELAGDQELQLLSAEEAYKRLPEEPTVIWSLQRAYRATAQWAEMGALFEDEARREIDPAAHLFLMSESIGAYLRGKQPAEAARVAQHCLTVDEAHLPSLRLLGWAARREQDWGALALLQDKLAECCADHDNRLESSLLAADLWAQRLGKPAQALASLRSALADDPGQPEAFERAERLLRMTGDYGQLSQLYARRIKVCADPAVKAELLHQQARLLHERLAEDDGAITKINELLELEPEHLEALNFLAELLCKQQRWSDATATLGTISRLDGELHRRQEARLREARIWLDHLYLADRANAVLKRALEEDPSSSEAKQLMVEVAFSDGQWSEAQRLLEEIGAEENPKLQVWAMSRLAEVARAGLEDPELQERCENEALLLAAPHADLLAALIEQYRLQGELKRLVKIGTEVIEQNREPAIAEPLVLAIARVLLEDLDQPSRMQLFIHDCHVFAPDHKDSSLLVALALERQGEVEEAVASYRKLLELDAACVEAYRGLSRLMGILGYPDVAVAGAAVVHLLGQATSTEVAQVEASGTDKMPPGAIDVGALPCDPELKSVAELFSLVLPHFNQVFPMELHHPLRPTHPVAVATKEMSDALGLSGIRTSMEGEAPAVAGMGDPVPLQISASVASQPQGARFRFWIGRSLASAATACSLLDRQSDAELDGLILALCTTHPIDTSQQQLRKQLLKALPRKVRKQVEQLQAPRMSAKLWARYRAQETARADQIGVLFSRNPKIAISELAAQVSPDEDFTRSPRLCALMKFSVSESYEKLHYALWSKHRGA